MSSVMCYTYNANCTFMKIYDSPYEETHKEKCNEFSFVALGMVVERPLLLREKLV